MEAVFSTDKFNKPKVLKGKEEIAVLLIRLVKLEPGDNPLHPEMGIGLLKRYKHCEKGDIPDLQLEIKKQIQVYLPEYQSAEIIVDLEVSGILRLSINVDDSLYKFTTSENPSLDEMSLN